jgi:hypothetical protein
MNYCALLTPHHLAMVHDWLANSENVFVRIERPHSGGTGDSHTIRSLNDLRALLTRESHPEIEIFIFQMPTVPDDELHRVLERDWVYRNPDRVLYLGVQKNRSRYEPYEQHPTRYEGIVQEWRATP